MIQFVIIDPDFFSAHTDCIITEDHDVAELFLRQVDRYAIYQFRQFSNNELVINKRRG